MSAMQAPTCVLGSLLRRLAAKWVANTGVFTAEEQKGIATVLDAAALTYIAAALQSIATLLYYSSILSGGNRRRRY